MDALHASKREDRRMCEIKGDDQHIRELESDIITCWVMAACKRERTQDLSLHA